MIRANPDPDTLALACATAMLGRDRTAQSLGITIEEVREGSARVAMTVTETMINSHDTVHGGVTFTLADTAFAFACNSRNESNVALQASISFTKAGRLGDRFVATAQELVGGKGRTGLYDVNVTLADGSPIAVFRGVCYRISKPVLVDS